MDTVVSSDGTRIGYERTGSGPPLVLVHGTAGSSGRWGPALPALAATFTICDMDRRGRGASGDSDDYVLEREFEDVAAVVDSLDGPVSLLGHSFGGICALEAALLTDKVDKLILNEPPIAAPATPLARAQNARLEALLASGDRESVLVAFLRDSVGISEQAVNQMRQAPSWEARLATAHTLPREHRAVFQYELQPQRFAGLNVPTLLLLGGDSPALFVESTQLIDAALSNSEIVVLPGQQHAPMNTAPELFARAVMNFLLH